MEEVDDFLEHYGVAGMKWGVRKSKAEAGISRSRQALIEKNNNQMKFLTSVRKGDQRQRTKAFGEMIIGKKQWEKNYKTTMSTLKAQNKRLVSNGKLSLKDKMSIFAQVSILDLYVSQTPNKKKFNPYVSL